MPSIASDVAAPINEWDSKSSPGTWSPAIVAALTKTRENWYRVNREPLKWQNKRKSTRFWVARRLYCDNFRRPTLIALGFPQDNLENFFIIIVRMLMSDLCRTDDIEGIILTYGYRPNSHEPKESQRKGGTNEYHVVHPYPACTRTLLTLN